jgi:hypothetical protein
MSSPVSPISRPSAFRRHVWPLLWQHRLSIGAALVLVGISGAAVAIQNVFPKWLFSYRVAGGDLPRGDEHPAHGVLAFWIPALHADA